MNTAVRCYTGEYRLFTYEMSRDTRDIIAYHPPQDAPGLVQAEVSSFQSVSQSLLLAVVTQLARIDNANVTIRISTVRRMSFPDSLVFWALTLFDLNCIPCY